jgi:hypothetical protein
VRTAECFFAWCNAAQHHSGLGLLTRYDVPQAVMMLGVVPGEEDMRVGPRVLN